MVGITPYRPGGADLRAEAPASVTGWYGPDQHCYDSSS